MLVCILFLVMGLTKNECLKFANFGKSKKDLKFTSFNKHVTISGNQ